MEMKFDGFRVKQISDMDVKLSPNPFHHDLFNMGQTLGKNCTIMYANHTTDICKFIKIINTDTGKQIIVYFDMEER